MRLTSRITSPYLFIGIGLLYVCSAFAVFDALPLKATRDARLYKAVAALPLTDAEFWTHWRPFTLPLILKLTGIQDRNFAYFQFVFALAAWLTLASLTAILLKNRLLKLTGFAAILCFGLSLDVLQWTKIVTTESLDVSFAIFILIIWYLVQKGVRQQTNFPFSRQVLIGVGFGLLLILWGFTLPTNMFIALAMAGILILALVIWRRLLWQWRPFLMVMLVVLPGIYLARSQFISDANSWQLGLANHIAERILPDPEKTAFFAERGMPTDENVMRFTGYVPANRAGDWQAAYGDWLTQKGRRAFIEYLLWNPPARIGEVAWNQDKVLNPNGLLQLGNHYADGRQSAAVWQQENNYRLYDASSIVFIGAGIICLILMVILVLEKRWDWRLLIPLCLVLIASGMIYLIWYADAYEPRHFVTSSTQFRVGILLITLFSVDSLTAQRPSRPFLKMVSSVAVCILILLAIIEIFAGYRLLRDKVTYPVLSSIFPHNNLLQPWGVDGEEYRLYQDIEQDERILTLHTEIIDGISYPRQFILLWGSFGRPAELFPGENGQMAVIWRNTPVPLSDASPDGPVMGPLPLDVQTAPIFHQWQTTFLPGNLQDANIRYVYADALAWQLLPPYQRNLLSNPDYYRPVHERLFRVNHSARTWMDVAAENPATLGMSPATYEAYQLWKREHQTDDVIFTPLTGIQREDLLLTVGGMIEAAGGEDKTALFELLSVLETMQFDPADAESVSAWRNTKAPEDLPAVDYLLVDEQWMGWLTAEELARFNDPEQYELIREWQGIIPVTYRLYQPLK